MGLKLVRIKWGMKAERKLCRLGIHHSNEVTPIVNTQVRTVHPNIRFDYAALNHVIVSHVTTGSAETPFPKSWGGWSPATGMGEAVEHEADRGQGDHRLGDLGQRLVAASDRPSDRWR